jgi:VWFA-related protein
MAPAAAQTGEPTAKPTSQTSLDAGQLVCDLIVRDRHSRPVRDLRPEEIEITDDGVPAQITGLRLAGGGNPGSGADSGSSVEVPLVSFVFDEPDASALKLAQPAAMGMLSSLAGTGAYFSVWRITDRLELLQPFTRDNASVSQAIEAATSSSRNPSEGSQLARAPAPVDNPTTALLPIETQLALNARLTIDRWQRIERDEPSRPSVSGLLALARQQGALKGRKVVLYFSDALQLGASTFEQAQSVIASANQSRVSIYAVNAGGLAGAAEKKPGADSQPAPAQPDQTHVLFLQLQTGASAPSPLQQLSEATGGFYIRRSNDLPASVRKIAEDLTTYYEVAYSPRAQDYDGRFRAVSVKVNRPQTRLQSRQGYFSLPPQAGMEMVPFEVPLFKALGAAEKAETIPFRGEVLRFGPAEGKARAALAMEIPLSNLTCREDPATLLCDMRFSVLAVVKGPDGSILQKFSQEVSQQAAMEPPRQGIFTFQRHFVLDPGEYRVEAVLRDHQANKVSWKAIPFSLTATADLSVSDAALVRGLESLKFSGDAGDPLLYQGLQVVPHLGAQWSRSNRDLPVFFIINPDPRIPAQPKLLLELSRAKRVVAKPQAPLPDARPGTPIPLVVYLKKAQLEPGSYQLLAKVTQGKSSFERKLAFDVQNPPAALPSPPPGPQSASTIMEGPLAFDQPEPKLIESAVKPTEAELKRILDAARERAVEYKNALPNFLCVTKSSRFARRRGHGEWNPEFSTTGQLQYVGGVERTETIRLEGADAAEARKLQLSGEFGKILNVVFADSAGAIEWRGLADINGARVHVFEYRVPRKISSYTLQADAMGSAIATAYHGLIHVDANSMGVRRITAQAEAVPPDFPIQESILSVDYDYIHIAGQRVLLPQHAVLEIRQGSRIQKLDRVFRNYRKFRSETEIRYAEDLGIAPQGGGAGRSGGAAKSGPK